LIIADAKWSTPFSDFGARLSEQLLQARDDLEKNVVIRNFLDSEHNGSLSLVAASVRTRVDVRKGRVERAWSNQQATLTAGVQVIGQIQLEFAPLRAFVCCNSSTVWSSWQSLSLRVSFAGNRNVKCLQMRSSQSRKLQLWGSALCSSSVAPSSAGRVYCTVSTLNAGASPIAG